MRNLNRLSWAANTLQAWAEWNYYEAELAKIGLSEVVVKHRPPESAGWRIVDKHIYDLRAELESMRDQP